MVRIYITFLILIFNINIFAGEFKSEINKSKINIDEKLLLTFTLSDTKSISNPDISKINNNFNIISTAVFSSVKIINGVSSLTTQWKYMLTPKKLGKIKIPQIQINTKNGLLESEELIVEVAKDSEDLNQKDDSNKNDKKSDNSNSRKNDVFIKTKLTPSEVYAYQPFFYTVYVYSKYKFTGQLQNLSIKEMVPVGEVKMHQQRINGVNMHVGEITYIITPLNDKILKIPSQDFNLTYNAVDNVDFNDIFDMQSYLNPNVSRKIINKIIKTKEQDLEILPVPVNVKHWLPVKSLELTDKLHNAKDKEFFENKEFSYSITIKVNGAKSNQLPDLNLDSKDFKIYREEPSEHEKIINRIYKKEIISEKTYNFTLIPNKSGKLKLPQITVEWWDINKKKLIKSKTKKHIIEVKPDNRVKQKYDEEFEKEYGKEEENNNIFDLLKNNLYIFLGIFLSIILSLILFVIFYFRNKNKGNNNNLGNIGTYNNKSANSTISYINMKDVKNAKELYNYLKNYMCKNFDLPKNMSLQKIMDFCKENSKKDLNLEIDGLKKELEYSLYYNKKQDINIDLLKKKSQKIIKNINNRKKKVLKKEDNKSGLTKLNMN